MKLIIISLVAIVFLFGCIDLLNPTKPPKYQCGGIAGLDCPKEYVCIVTDDGVADATGDCIPEDQINSTVKNTGTCDLNKTYEVSSTAGPGCSCPTGYEFDSKVIGYKYIGNVESPILEVVCVKLALS